MLNGFQLNQLYLPIKKKINIMSSVETNTHTWIKIGSNEAPSMKGFLAGLPQGGYQSKIGETFMDRLSYETLS